MRAPAARFLLFGLLLILSAARGDEENVKGKRKQTWAPAAAGRWRTPGGSVSDDSDNLDNIEPPDGMGAKEWARMVAQMRDQLAAQDGAETPTKETRTSASATKAEL